MAEAWHSGRLGDLIELKRGYDLPIQERRVGFVPIVSSGGITGTHCESRVRGPGVVTGRYGTLGEVFYVESDFWPLNTTLYVRDFKGNDPRFISYFLRTVDYLAYSDKAAVPGLNRNHLHEAKARWPALPTQRAIAGVLAALDAKIELNRQTNETLEAMARALFKSWFIDFDPVRAKMEGRSSTLDAATVALFPAQLERNSLGCTPVGWRLAPLGDMLELKRGYDLPTAERRPGKVPIISSSGVCGFHDEAKVRGPGVVTGRYGTIGEVFMVAEDLWPLNTALYVRDFKGNAITYVYHVLRAFDFERFSDKAAVPGINRNHVHLEPVCIAPPEIQRRFESLVGAWIRAMREFSEESRTLSTLRDLLLPRLLSGELRVRDAERAVEAVV